MEYLDKLQKNSHFKSLSEEDQEVVVKIFEFVDEKDRGDAIELLDRQPSLIPILIENYLKKKKAAEKGGEEAVEKVAKKDEALIKKSIQ